MTRLNSFLTAARIASSNFRPPVLIRRLSTMPPRDRMEISVVSKPTLTTSTPWEFFTSMSSPRPSATAFSTTMIFFAFTLAYLIRS